jgi:hypothetical protein
MRFFATVAGAAAAENNPNAANLKNLENKVLEANPILEGT